MSTHVSVGVYYSEILTKLNETWLMYPSRAYRVSKKDKTSPLGCMMCVCVCDGSRLVTVGRPSRISSSRSRSRVSGWRRHGIQPTVSTTPYVDRVPLSAITVTGLLPRRRRRHDTTSLGCNLLLRQSSCRLLMLVN